MLESNTSSTDNILNTLSRIAHAMNHLADLDQDAASLLRLLSDQISECVLALDDLLGK